MSREQIGLTGHHAPVFGRDDVEAGDWIETSHALPETGIPVLVVVERASVPAVARRMGELWRLPDGRLLDGVLLGDMWAYIPDAVARKRTLENVRVLEEVAL